MSYRQMLAHEPAFVFCGKMFVAWGVARREATSKLFVAAIPTSRAYSSTFGFVFRYFVGI